jgi:hypothetical protein
MIRLFRRSGIISERELELFCPKPNDDKSIERIRDTATLYRRFQPDHFDLNGDLNPAYFAFPKKKDKQKSGQSFLLKGLASPFHALHPNCNDAKPLTAGLWEVFRLAVSSIPKTIPDPEERMFYFSMIHTPYATCKAHCELFCSDNPDRTEYVIPGSVVRTKIRIQISREFRTTGVKLLV